MKEICISNQLHTKFYSQVIVFNMNCINSYNIVCALFDVPHNFQKLSINIFNILLNCTLKVED